MTALIYPYYEDDGRKWIRQTYYPNTNRLETRLTGYGQTILKREFFRYDGNGALTEEIWDDGVNTEKGDLTGITERHIRITTPRTAFPIGLPQIVQEFYYDSGTKTNYLLKQIINEHSPEGRILSQQHYGSDGQLAYTLYWKYNHLGNVIEEGNALGEVIIRTFDANGNKLTEQGPRNDFYQAFVYDYSNRPVQEKEVWSDGKTFVTNHRYNLLSQKVATIDPCGQETRFTYDRLGRVIKTELPSVYTAQEQLITPNLETRYNALGQAIAMKDANGQWTKKQYTVRGQPYRITYPDGSIEQKEYSLDGLLIKETAKNQLITRYTHDALGRVIRKEKQDFSGNLLSATSTTYSTFQLLTETDEAGQITTYRYDGAGRRISMTKGDQVTTYAYDALGRQVKETQGDACTTREYDKLNRVIEERIEDSTGSLLTKEQYQYDSSGNRTHVTLFTQAGIATHVTLYNPHKEPTLHHRWP